MDFLNTEPAMRILLVEDDELLGDGLQAGLRHCGFNADWLQDGELARSALKTEDYAAVVLDLGLPRLDGLSLLRWLRGAGKTLPVLVLTARDTTPDKVDGLDSGADDYISLTDIARHKNADHSDDLIRNWLRNRNTLEFLGIWEQLNNPGFNSVEFDGIKMQAGLNSFSLSPKALGK